MNFVINLYCASLVWWIEISGFEISLVWLLVVGGLDLHLDESG